MSSILRRLTSQLDQKSAETQGGSLAGGVGGNSIAEDGIMDREDRRLMSTVSFNDFSMHVMMDEDHGKSYGDITVPTSQTATMPVALAPPLNGSDVHNPNLGKIRTPQSAIKVTTNSMKIPRTSVAAILGTPKSSSQSYEDTTPRSSLDLFDGSGIPTPRASISREADGEGSSPVSPKSPRTPGGRRKKQNKIHGLDYYEFCELVRAGSL